MNLVPGQPYYYGTWTGYNPPVKPLHPLDYADAEPINAFSVFVFDDQGRVVSFEKWLATTTGVDPALLAGRHLTPGRHFFAPGRDASGGLGPELTLDDTKRLSDYYRALVDTNGRITAFEHVRRERMIRHEYSYWENGRVREFRYDTGQGRGGLEHFDRDGRLVSTP